MLPIEEKAKDIGVAIELLNSAHAVLVDCLRNCDDRALEQPIPTRSHGQSAAHFFWVMLMHDTYHAGQIRTRRTLYQAQTAEQKHD